MDWLQWWNIKILRKNLKSSAKNKKWNCSSLWLSLRHTKPDETGFYPQCATQFATQWDSQNHMKRAIENYIETLNEGLILLNRIESIKWLLMSILIIRVSLLHHITQGYKELSCPISMRFLIKNHIVALIEGHITR